MASDLIAALKPPIRGLLHPLRKPITWACQRGFLSSRLRGLLPWQWPLEPFTIYGSGWKCRWFPAEFDDIGCRVFWSGLRQWEKETSPVILDNVRRSYCFVDIGANCGIYTVMACAVNPNIRVVAVEPVPRICAALENNVRRNQFHSRVTIVNAALADSNGTVPFHEAEDATMGSLSPDGYSGQPGKTIEVSCRTLDSIVSELKIEPDFLKIDVEGFEHVVLAGANQVLGKFRPRIVLEANPGDPGDRMTETLSRYRYDFFVLTGKGPVRQDAIVPRDPYYNWLCVPRADGPGLSQP